MTFHTSSTPGRERPRKALLVCPECGHESASDGDWIVRERAGRAVYACPVCGTAITTRSPSELPQYA